jgi:TonB-dependent receptor
LLLVARAEAQQTKYEFHISEETMGPALSLLAQQAHLQLLFSYQLARVRGLRPVNGQYTIPEALEYMLKDTGFSGGLTARGIITITLRETGCKSEGKVMPLETRTAASVVALLVGALGTPTCSAQATAGHAVSDSETMETVVITGFRASLEKSLDVKRNSLGATDSIFAEDIGKFPDTNVAESLQRIPGVALQRGSGEGEQITVRGLGPQFTRVRINGIEAMATTMDSANGTNRGRGFDFNVFASELFTQLTVRKTTAAEIEEGSLGATVDLHTAHPFDKSGFVLTGSAQAGYQELADTVSPRLAAMVSNTFMGGRLGVLFSAAYENKRTEFEPSNTNNWNYGSSAALKYASVNGLKSGTEFDTVNAAYAPRIPRYEITKNSVHRLGLTSSVQWQPDDKTVFTLDGLYADFSAERTTADLEAIAFSVSGNGSSLGTGLPVTLGHSAINVVGYTLDSKRNSLLMVKATNVGARVESRLDHLDTRFMQATLDGTREFSEKLKTHVLLGWTESHHRNPIQTTVTADYNCSAATSASGCSQTGGVGTAADPFVYDYTGNNYIPAISYGNVDVTSPDGWFLSQIRERAEYVFNSFRTIQAEVDYTPWDAIRLQGGVDYKNYGFNTFETRRSNGTTSNQDSVIPTAIETGSIKDYAKVVSLNINVPKGTDTTWWVPDLDKFNALYHIWDPTVYNGAFNMGVEPGLNNSGKVIENDYGAWVQSNWTTQFYGLPFSGNVGLRYILTEQWSQGYSYNSATKALTANTRSQTYHDILPSFNMVLEPADNFLIRLNGSYAMARPDLSSSFPKATVVKSGSSLAVTLGNPVLKPYRSKNLDLSYEWYYHKGALLSVAFFYKHIDSFVQTLSSEMTYHGNPYGLSDDLVLAACGSAYGTSCNENLPWTFQRPINTKGGPLYGTEISWQQPFDFLPDRLQYLGMAANVTFVQATQNYLNADGSLLAKADLTSLSRNTANATIYYDDQIFQARLSVSSRSKYLNAVPASYGADYGVTKGVANVDAALSYKLDDNIMFTFDVINLTDQAEYSYVDSRGERANSWTKTGRSIYFGTKFTY